MAPPNDAPAVRLAHAVPGRARLRIAWLPAVRRRGDHDVAAALGDAVARIPGVRAVEIRAATGSVLCEHDRELPADRLVEQVAALAACHAPAPEARRRRPTGRAPAVAEELRSLLATLDDRILALTEGRLDLATFASLGLVGAGAVHVVAEGRLPFPRWSDLAWWATQTFAEFEHPEDGGR